MFTNPKLRACFPELTEKQFSTLTLYAIGKTTKDIQLTIGCSRTTVEKHLSNARYIMNCSRSGELRTVFFLRVLMHLFDGEV